MREDKITPHLGAALLCARYRSQGDLSHLDIPRDLAEQAALIKRMGLLLTYDHAAKALSVPTRTGPVAISLR